MESRRLRRGHSVQRHVLYLGEISDSQRAAWQRLIDVFDDKEKRWKQLVLFPSDREVTVSDKEIVQVQLSKLKVERPRQWGACWLACELWRELRLAWIFTDNN